MKSQEPITLFSFGYWGWGNATQQLVNATDAVEKSRGFEPPLFVDTRISRSVRAKGFSGNAFEETVGQNRYVWMRGLGNEAVLRRRGPPVQIRNPKDAEVLLQLALQNAKRRRLIFFCSCEWPRTPDGECHRMTVGSLVLEAAECQHIAVEIVEWPGESPKVVTVTLSPADFRKAQNASSIPISRDPETELLGLPWGSVAEVSAGENQSRHLVGPARFRSGRWVLPKLTDELGNEVPPAPGLRTGTEWRRRWDFEPRISTHH